MLQFFDRAAGFIDRISDLTGRTIAWLTFAMVLITCAIVIARYFFGFGSIGLQESVMYLHGIVFMLGIGYTLKERGHVRVDVLYEKFSARTKDIVDLLGHLAFLMPVAGFIPWPSRVQSWIQWPFTWHFRHL